LQPVLTVDAQQHYYGNACAAALLSAEHAAAKVRNA
jgi:hypothetical protein